MMSDTGNKFTYMVTEDSEEFTLVSRANIRLSLVIWVHAF